MLHRRLPIIQAPMAGGPSTPELAAAVSAAGGLGYLAGGYLTAEKLLEFIDATRAQTDEPFGVNLFVPAPPNGAAGAAQQHRAAPDQDSAAKSQFGAVAAYREALAPHAEAVGATLPAAAELPWDDDDHYAAKLDALCALDQAPALVSFTFGLPRHDDVARLRARGTLTVATVTTEAEARAAVALGVDGLCVQGPEGGGHRGTHDAQATPDERDLLSLLRAIRTDLGKHRGDAHLTATGGIDSPERVHEVLAAGADAVQIGTAYLQADEAGTSTTHRAALATFTADTVVTRAFTGRAARALPNRVTRELSAAAPAAYPALHHLTRPLRAAAAATGDAERLHLWAGARYRTAPAAPAQAITQWLGGDIAEIAPFITGG